MASGPVTFVPLFSPDNQAVEYWRTHSPDSLRCLALDSDKNLLHGSDSPESAQREISLLADFLEQLILVRSE